MSPQNKSPRTIRKILIANRGEIAVRIIKTCRRLGIKSLAVFSNPDAQSMAVQMADEAVALGGESASESYLQGEKLITIALKHGADAIHPGYGFLSENPDFAEACAQAGIIFIGPSPKAMRAMALKGEAKALMQKAGVPIVPGYHGPDQSNETLISAAKSIGYPVLIKAVAGGGGKGMRQAFRDEDLPDALEAARREGQNSFGNPALLIEKYLEKPRHIEIQLFSDRLGNHVHLWERDCSLQRRHQKVIEEAPAPGMSDRMRRAMGDAACNAARAIGYEGAGTVEFIVDVAQGLDKAPFYFMEMNTRLQVEHPVSEMITGQDLVEWQIRVAEGQTLPLDQQSIDKAVTGHAVEARLYAEDPARDFTPAIGQISLFNPEQTEKSKLTHCRIDTGIKAGDQISVFYDPMIAKLIAFGKDRSEAIARLRGLIEQTPIAGLATNRHFLWQILGHEAFQAGALDTGFLARHRAALIPDQSLVLSDYILAALILKAQQKIKAKKAEETRSLPLEFAPSNRPAAPNSSWNQGDSFRLNLPATDYFTFQAPEQDGPEQDGAAQDGTPKTKSVKILYRSGPDLDQIHIESLPEGFAHDPAEPAEPAEPAAIPRQGRAFLVDPSSGLYRVTLDGLSFDCHAQLDAAGLSLIRPAHTKRINFYRPESIDIALGAGTSQIIAPMPGKILDILVQDKALVKKGDPLLIMEAMKMEQTLKAPRAGQVKFSTHKTGDLVSDGAILMEITNLPDASPETPTQSSKHP